jgi:hypothetical protein
VYRVPGLSFCLRVGPLSDSHPIPSDRVALNSSQACFAKPRLILSTSRGADPHANHDGVLHVDHNGGLHASHTMDPSADRCVDRHAALRASRGAYRRASRR